MRPKLKITEPGTYQQVRDAFDSEGDVKRKRKIHVIRLGFLGEYSSEEIAKVVGCSKASVTNWVREYRNGGLEELLRTHYRSGRKASLNEQVCAELIEGLTDGRWKRMKEIRKWLADEHEITLSNGGMQYWLKKVGAALKVPRKSHVKKDESQSVAFKDGLANKLGQIGIAPAIILQHNTQSNGLASLLPTERREAPDNNAGDLPSRIHQPKKYAVHRNRDDRDPIKQARAPLVRFHWKTDESLQIDNAGWPMKLQATIQEPLDSTNRADQTSARKRLGDGEGNAPQPAH